MAILSETVRSLLAQSMLQWENVRGRLEEENPELYARLANRAGHIPELAHKAEGRQDPLGHKLDGDPVAERTFVDEAKAFLQELQALNGEHDG